MKSLPYILPVILFLLVGCSANSPPDDEEIIDLLVDGSFEKVYKDHFASDLQDSTSLEEISKEWEARAKGEYVETHSVDSTDRGDSYRVVEAKMDYSNSDFLLRLTFNKDNQLVGFATSDLVLKPDSVTEEEVTVGEGTDYELGGTLTLPKETSDHVPAVVLVHGSGPSNRDEAVYAYKPFQDIAWGLAEQGIAVLRYDKRTYTYDDPFTPEQAAEFTVQEETVEDAIRAGELLKNDPRINSDHVYLVGHSLGAILAPRIDFAGDFAGLIMLAGSPRPLWEISYDQNMALNLNQEEQQFVQQEYEKAQQLEEMTEEEAKQETLFGMPAYYFKEMEDFNAGSLAAASTKPMLILQGEDDFQIYADIDFALWEEILQGKDNATLISYPGLNHFFIDYDGPFEGTIAEYKQPGTVDTTVINDMADWIWKQNE